jgi:acyl carrier protein
MYKEEKLISIINEIVISKNPSLVIGDFNKNYNLRADLGFDSFDLAELTVNIEDEFDIDVFEDGIIGSTDELRKKLQF